MRSLLLLFITLFITKISNAQITRFDELKPFGWTEFSEDEKYINYRSGNEAVYIIDTKSKQIIKSFNQPDGATNLNLEADYSYYGGSRFSNNSKYLYLGIDSTIQVWDIEGMEEIAGISTDYIVGSMVVSSSNMITLPASPNKKSPEELVIDVWSIKDVIPQKIYSIQTDSLYSIPILLKDYFIIQKYVDGINGKFEIYDLKGGEFITEIEGVFHFSDDSDNSIYFVGKNELNHLLKKRIVGGKVEDDENYKPIIGYDRYLKNNRIQYFDHEENTLVSVDLSDGKSTVVEVFSGVKSIDIMAVRKIPNSEDYLILAEANIHYPSMIFIYKGDEKSLINPDIEFQFPFIFSSNLKYMVSTTGGWLKGLDFSMTLIELDVDKLLKQSGADE